MHEWSSKIVCVKLAYATSTHWRSCTICLLTMLFIDSCDKNMFALQKPPIFSLNLSSVILKEKSKRRRQGNKSPLSSATIRHNLQRFDIYFTFLIGFEQSRPDQFIFFSPCCNSRSVLCIHECCDYIEQAPRPLIRDWKLCAWVKVHQPYEAQDSFISAVSTV